MIALNLMSNMSNCKARRCVFESPDADSMEMPRAFESYVDGFDSISIQSGYEAAILLSSSWTPQLPVKYSANCNTWTNRSNPQLGRESSRDSQCRV